MHPWVILPGSFKDKCHLQALQTHVSSPNRGTGSPARSLRLQKCTSGQGVNVWLKLPDNRSIMFYEVPLKMRVLDCVGASGRSRKSRHFHTHEKMTVKKRQQLCVPFFYSRDQFCPPSLHDRSQILSSRTTNKYTAIPPHQFEHLCLTISTLCQLPLFSVSSANRQRKREVSWPIVSIGFDLILLTTGLNRKLQSV